ncbi:4Fe-4S ferredoxin [Pseudoflavonifractor sp. AF19-9AC]|uniref:EFR1 family ferrodoxin n=1 Tax=Pseudoflavonifractor sp. AF19-9AC TaxID=2292244 RepID=UPI000E554EDF|nr:EFR1 family ferrodoxin [Pseudoflavonifractor sp. AF19-9AC]RHR10068.1 4Fe-4S ferredoxin [Pseudoflavonifractor sp. AF19-9AC]
MIFYFSGTGNSAWVARQLARLTGDVAYDITNLNEQPDMANAKQIGFVFPVYAWGVPEIMAEFVKTLPKTQAFTFGICTCGGDAGRTMKRFSKLYPLSSSYSLLMPNNYIISSEPDGEDEILRKITAAREELDRIAQELRRQVRVYRVHEGALAGVKSHLVNFGFNKFARSTKSFFVEDSCNGCGQCARNCPASAISLRDGMPVWAAQCCQCLRCINECPQQAIQYGTSTAGRRRYTIRAYLPQDEQI